MKRKVFFFITVLWLITSVLVIQSTYAKYLTSLSSEGSINVASWDIALNNQDIINNSNFTSTLSLTVPGTTYYATGALVPTAIGYFDLNIDATNVILDVRYTVTCQFPATNDVTDLQIIGYSLGPSYSTTTNLSTPSAAITRTVIGGNSEDIRIYVKWIDDNQVTFSNYSQVLDDDDDTDIAIDGGSGVIQVNVSFEQLH